MKILTLVITIFSLLSANAEENHADLFSGESYQACPEQESFDWVAINLFLTADNMEVHRTKSDIRTYTLHSKEIDSILGIKEDWEPRTQEDVLQYWSAIGIYWLERGVEPVSDSKVCELIDEVLNSDVSIQNHQETHVLRTYFKIDNKYLVIYKSKRLGTGLTPVRILDEDFEIINSFGM